MKSQSTEKIEARRAECQASLDSSKSPAERNRLGQFATPNSLAIDIARFAATFLDPDSNEIDFADPSVGTGSFYSAARTVFGPERLRSAVGIEVDSEVASVAEELWTESGLDVIRGDFTRIIEEGKKSSAPNLILANPPYVRHHHIERADKERLKVITSKLCGVDVNGLAGLYVYFVLLATAWMKEGGIAAWLIPSEFMDVNYGEYLKRFLADRVTLLRVHRFDPADAQFGDAIVSSAVLVFQKAPAPMEHEVEFTFGGTLTEPRFRECVTRMRLEESRKWTAFPHHPKNDRVSSIADSTAPVLSDLFRIRRGIATGDNKFFILDRAEALKKGFPAEYLRPILPAPRHLKVTAIDSDESGYPKLDPQLCVIDCDLSEKRVERLHPALWAYLQTAEDLGVKEGYLVGKRTPWYKQEHREPAPFLCTYMGRGTEEKQPFRFIWNRSRAIASNLYLMLYPQKALSKMLELHPERFIECHSLLTLVTGRELRGEGRVYGGGLNKIEPSELGRISARSFLSLWPELSEQIRRSRTPSLFE